MLRIPTELELQQLAASMRVFPLLALRIARLPLGRECYCKYTVTRYMFTERKSHLTLIRPGHENYVVASRNIVYERESLCHSCGIKSDPGSRFSVSPRHCQP